jgi:hypothetical protein
MKEVKETLKNTNFRIYKYVFVIDTNICFNKRFSYDVLNNRLLKELIEIRDEYNLHNSLGNISLNIPQIVKEERLFQKKQIFNTNKPNIGNRLKELNDLELVNKFEDVLKQYPSKLENNLEKELQKDKILTIPYCDDSYLKEIIKKAVDKKTPFRAVTITNNELIGEQGFKDCVLWYSIFSHAMKIPRKTPHIYVLLTANIRDFNSVDNIKEFEDKTGHKIRIINYALKTNELNKMFMEDFKTYQIHHVEINYKLKENNSYVSSANIYSDGLIFDVSLENKSYIGEISLQKADIIKDIEEELGREISSDVSVEFILDEIAEISVSIEYYKWFYRISSINLWYSNGDEEEVDYKFYDGMEWVLLEDEEGNSKKFETDVYELLKEAGYDCDDVNINYSVTEYTEDD